MIPGSSLFLSGKRPAITPVYAGAIAGNTAGPRTYASVPIGNPSPTRKVVVVTGGFRNISFTNTVIIGGVTATAEVQTGTYDSIGIYSAVVPSGTTADIVISSSTPVDTLYINVFVIENLTVPGSTSFVRSVQGVSSPATLSVSSILPWTAIIAVANNRSTAGTFTWGAISKAYEGVANVVDNSSAYSVYANGGSSINFTAGYSAGIDNLKAAVVGWV